MTTNLITIKYKHTQISYLMLLLTVVVIVLFTRAYIIASTELPSPDSGPNFAVTLVMALIVYTLASIISLRIVVDENYLRIRFGFGFFHKKIPLHEVISVKSVKNRWYYGWGIRVWFWPKMWMYNVSGFNAVEIELKNRKTYRIGTNEPKKLEQAILHSMS